MQGRIILLGLSLAGLPSAAMANVIFPALIVTGRMLAWWVIAVSLIVEFFFVKAAFRLSPANAAFATLAANGLSAALGVFAIPYLGLFFEFGLYPRVLPARSVGIRSALPPGSSPLCWQSDSILSSRFRSIASGID